MMPREGETTVQYRLDLMLGICFLVITFFAFHRSYQSWQSFGGRKVISVFNTLIFIAALARALWFLIPNYYIETQYDPAPLMAFQDDGWLGDLLSESLLLIGSYALYGVFILIACYWLHMLRKLDPITESHNNSVHNHLNNQDMNGSYGGSSNNNGNIASPGISRESAQSTGTLEMFTTIMSVTICIEALNIMLFLSGFYNSEELILYDGILFSMLSLATLCFITYLSRQINIVLVNMEIINQSSSKAQIKRIYAIVLLANFFFLTRIVFEVLSHKLIY